MDEFELRDYFSILKRRIKHFVSAFLTIFIISFIFALYWSNYRSTATVEIARSEISAETTRPVGMSANDYNESLADQRISHLQQKVMSISSLTDIIRKFNLYPESRQATPITEVAEKMLKKIRLDLVSSILATPSAAQKASAGDLSAIAFTLSFDYSDAIISQQVTQELVSRFLSEDLKDRQKAAHETSQFLDVQIKALEKSLDEQGGKIADFKAANAGSEQELLPFNQQAAQSILINLQTIDSQIIANEGTQGTLRGQIAAADPYTRVISDGQVLTTPATQLKALKAQFATLSAQYGPEHPDVIKMSREIKALEKQVGGHTDDSAVLQAKINDVRTNLAAAQKTYGPDHPDVIALRRQLSVLEERLAALPQNPSPDDSIKEDADNPAYLQLVAELKSAEEQHKSLMTQKDALLAQQAKYQNAIASNPVAQQKLAELTRDYENSQIRYRELKEKKMTADMSEAIEMERSGQKLIVINPPEVPAHTQPSRSLFVIGGFILAFMGGFGSVAAVQFVSRSIIGPRHLESVVGVAPLVTIPHIYAPDERKGMRQNRIKTPRSANG